MKLFTLTIPASTANLGPGFDSMGMALKKYLTLKVYKEKSWEFEHHSPCLPDEVSYDKHFIYQVALDVAEQYDRQLPTCRVVVSSDIPLARGLGSSAAAVVAGIELTNQLCHLSLTDEDKLLLASRFEGHPDNVAPSLFGGLIVTATPTKNKIDYLKLAQLNLDIVLYIPDVKLKTEDSRKVIPPTLSHEDAALASGIGNLMVAALLSEDYELAGDMMEADQFHEPFRAKLIPDYNDIKRHARQSGAYATVISGAGPTMISFVPKDQGLEIAKKMQGLFPKHEVVTSEIDYSGVQVDKIILLA